MSEFFKKAFQYNLKCYLGDDLPIPIITWSTRETKTSPAVPVDFTGCTALGQIKRDRRDVTPLGLIQITLGGSTGTITLLVPRATINTLGLGVFVFDVQVTHSDTTVKTYIQGTLTVLQDVSR